MTASRPATLHVEPPLRGELAFATEREIDGAAVEALVDRAFGPGRFAKTAERLREGGELRRDLSVCAWEGDRLAGAVRQWSILIGDDRALFLGPIAVDLRVRSQGVGAGLMRHAIAAATEAGERLILLVGDLPYFEQFGFEVASGVVMPGPVDPRRLLWKPLSPGGADGVGGPARPLSRV
jgi:predicted N-acetyltransferase YhbS